MSTAQVEIYSQGRMCAVTDAQLDELQGKRVDWFLYCLWRQTHSHEQAVALLTEDQAPPGTPDKAL